MGLSESTVWLHEGLSSYEQVRKGYEAGLLDDIFGPLGALVSPGDRVVLKPNLVKEGHLLASEEWEQVITNPVVVECALREVLKALKGRGSVVIADAPQADADWLEIMRRTGLENVAEKWGRHYGVPVSCVDLREEYWIARNGVVVSAHKQFGDPLGYVSVDLGSSNSEYFDKPVKNYYGADYDTAETRRYHNETSNVYVFSRTVLSADVFINLPKMKTHKLAGMTGSLKNIVGACIVKNSLPHHTLGGPLEGGDQFAEESGRTNAEGFLKKMGGKLLSYKKPFFGYPIAIAKKWIGKSLGMGGSVVRNGSWYGNDTIWRAVVDLNKVLLYADAEGNMHKVPQRKYYAVIDGVVAGEGSGPLAPDRKETGVLFAGNNPVALDAAQAWLMGFDYRSIPSIVHGLEARGYGLFSGDYRDIALAGGSPGRTGMLAELDARSSFGFRPHFGWAGHVELVPGDQPSPGREG
ncbi:hypothetical protein ADCFC_15730 [Adlercreutzia hattorii]|uniref:DUF362 domain-containing protein n=1 Tax=Adlercreutzia hattorii TaxID=2707299 RepID=A0A6F8SNF3_9ACTN|nr:hypothetical protein ADCFC_16950 [Adlercreutzia hattorii]